MHQILNDVYWINASVCNCYLCRDEKGLCLIDTGMATDAGKITAALAEIGQSLADLTGILITHADFDHVRGLATCWKRSGATVYAGADSAAFLVEGKSPRHLPAIVQTIYDAFVSYTPLPSGAITIVEDGDTIPVLSGLEVMATPGHTMDHLSFYSPVSGALFAGDSLNTRGGKLQRSSPLITEDEKAADKSALRLLALSPTIYACGHGAPLNDHLGSEAARLAGTIHLKLEKSA